MYEGGTREPLFIKWPSVTEGGGECEVPVTSPDFYPTLLEVAGCAPLPRQHTDGVSLVPLLKGRNSLDREAIFWHYPHYGNQGGTPGASVRMGDYKLIEFYEDRRLELYDLRKDISEEYDLAAVKPGRVDTMRRALDGWRNSVEAKIPRVNPDWRVSG
jgi:arylsulfatase A-like enzyme